MMRQSCRFPSVIVSGFITCLLVISLQAGATGRTVQAMERSAQATVKSALPIASVWGVPEALVLAVIHVESRFQSDARSSAGAIGLMQVVPGSGGADVTQHMALPQQINAEMLTDPELNLHVGTAYLHLLKNHYLSAISDEDKRWLCAVAAYNGGLSALEKQLTAYSPTLEEVPFDELYTLLTTEHPFAETRNYVVKVWTHYHAYSAIMDAQVSKGTGL